MKFVQIVSDIYDRPCSGADLRNESIFANLSKFGKVLQVTPEMLLGPPTSGLELTASDFQPDLIVVEGVQLMAAAQHVRELYPSARFVFDFHNVESDLLRQQDFARLPSGLRLLAPIVFQKRWRRARTLDLLALDLAETVWVCSSKDRDRITKLCKCPPEIVIVPNLAPDMVGRDRPQAFTDTRNGPALLFVGHLGYAPNKRAVRHLVRKVMPDLLHHHRSARLIVAGRSPNARLIGMLEKANFVELIANPEDIAPIYAQADIVVVPLAEGGGSRIKILEALAIGRPIVATAKAVEGLELVPERHFLQAENAADTITAITRLSNDAALAQRLVAEGHAHLSETFTHERVRRKISTSL